MSQSRIDLLCSKFQPLIKHSLCVVTISRSSQYANTIITLTYPLIKRFCAALVYSFKITDNITVTELKTRNIMVKRFKMYLWLMKDVDFAVKWNMEKRLCIDLAARGRAFLRGMRVSGRHPCARFPRFPASGSAGWFGN